MPVEVRITLYIILALFALVLLSALFLYKPIRRFYYHRHPKEFFYRKISAVVRNGDYYLVNDIHLSLGGGQSAVIDHLIGGDKYIYLINDCYCEGALSASPTDNRWVYFRKDGKKEEIISPLRTMQNAMTRLTMQTGINSSFLVGIVLLNDDCFINSFQNGNGDLLLVPLSRLQKVVDSFEDRPLSPFAPKELRQVIHDIYELNQKGQENK